MRLAFESNNLDEIEEFVTETYASIRFKPRSQDQNHLQIIQNPLGLIRVDQAGHGFEADYSVEPTGQVMVLGVEAGSFPRVETGGVQNSYGPGDVFLAAQPDRPWTGRECRARVSAAVLEPALLSQVAATAPGRTEEPVRLTSYRPISPAAGRQLLTTIAFLRDHVMADPMLRDSPLVASTAPQLLAATVLSAFPNTALTDPTSADRHDAHPATLRRAMAFVDEFAHQDITSADIAAAAHVTIRTVQYAFRRHLGLTPMGYVRRVRLNCAHEELLAADPTTGTTVTEVAARWGFFHSGRFAQRYRLAYGHAPRQTLLRHSRWSEP